jgi:DNA (cytosine-5)-methyltransferase 1
LNENYYNEHDPAAAAWLRELIRCGHIAPGIVDERSIEDVTPDDLRGYTQCHFFAGVGVWSYALRLAGWPDDRPVWTGSCPCQPFSAAGEGDGFADERHLWPAFYHLIAQCRPAGVLGEQVASKAVDAWIDLVHADLEALGYAFGCTAFPSAGVGAPCIGDRLYWVGTTDRARLERYGRHVHERNEPGWIDAHASGSTAETGGVVPAGSTHGFWRESDWLLCSDGKRRPVRPGTFPMVDGPPARVGRLRAYGNAINAEAAAEFIRAARSLMP